MRIIIILILSILFSCSNNIKINCNYITDYYPNTSLAEIEFYSGNYKKAFVYYQKAFENCDAIRLGNHYDTDNFARVCAELGKDDLALEYIEKTVIKGGTLAGFQRNKVFDNIFKTKRGQNLISDYDKKREKYLNSLNMGLRSELQNMIRLDQKLNMTKFQDSMFLVNDKRLIEIFEKYGYPNAQVVGNYGIDQIQADPTILLLHTDDSIRINYFIPKIKDFIKNGSCPPRTLGAMYDNLELFNDQPQSYGTYENDSGGYANMISDISKVNANRKNIGLPTLEMTKRIDSLKRQYWESN